MSPIRKKAREIYRQTMLESWLIGVLTGLLITGLIALNLLAPGTLFIIVPLVCLPLMFSAHVVHLHSRSGQTITFTDNLKSYAAWFRRPFNSTFSFFFSLLKAVAVFFVLELTLSFIAQPILLVFNNGLNDSMEQLNALMTSETLTWDDVLKVFYANDNALLIYFCIIMVPAFGIAFIAFIYFCSRSSQSIYLRLRYPNGNPQMLKYVHNYFIMTNRGRAFGNYWAMNWPLYVLLVVGATGGAIGFSFISKDPVKLIAAALTGACFLGTFFLPFYLCNHEAIGEHYQKDYEDAINHVNEMVMKNMEAQVEVARAQQKAMEEALKHQQEEMEKEKQAEDKPVEEEKKDNE